MHDPEKHALGLDPTGVQRFFEKIMRKQWRGAFWYAKALVTHQRYPNCTQFRVFYLVGTFYKSAR